MITRIHYYQGFKHDKINELKRIGVKYDNRRYQK